MFQEGSSSVHHAKVSVISRSEGARREDVGAARDVLLEDVVLCGATDLGEVGALLLGGGDVEREQDRPGGVDRHRGRDLLERDARGEGLHVLQRGDRDADLADLALGDGVVGVVADLGRQVEGDGEAGLSLLEQELVAAVGLLSVGEAGVLAHRPEPAAVHGGLDAPGVRVLAGVAKLLVVVPLGEVFGAVERLELGPRGALEARLALLGAVDRLLVGALPPVVDAPAGHGHPPRVAPSPCPSGLVSEVRDDGPSVGVHRRRINARARAGGR